MDKVVKQMYNALKKSCEYCQDDNGYAAYSEDGSMNCHLCETGKAIKAYDQTQLIINKPKSVKDIVWDSVEDSVEDSVYDSVYDLVLHSVEDAVYDSVWNLVRGSVREKIEIRREINE